MDRKWYIIHTTPSYENKVKERLEAKIKEAQMEDFFGEILVPKEEVAELKNGKKVIKERRLYPGYVFLNMHFDDKAWHLVRKTPNVTGFVGGGVRPSPMPEAELNQIIRRVSESQEKPAPKVMFNKGETVRMTNGPFKDFNGTVDNADYEKGKATVLVSVFGRETPIEIAFSDIEKV